MLPVLQIPPPHATGINELKASSQPVVAGNWLFEFAVGCFPHHMPQLIKQGLSEFFKSAQCLSVCTTQDTWAHHLNVALPERTASVRQFWFFCCQKNREIKPLWPAILS
jgi:hypothetical protein